MDKKKQSMFWLVFAGLFGIVFLTLLTTSFYGYVLERTGAGSTGDMRTYKRHYVMVVGNIDSRFWNDVYDSARESAASHDAYVELKGMSQSTKYTLTDYMDMCIAAKVDGILLEFLNEEHLEDKINEAVEKGIPVVTILNDSPSSSRASYVGINPYQLGQEYGLQMEGLVRDMEGPVRITVLLNDNTVDSNQFQIFNQINNLMVTSRHTADYVKTESVRIPSVGAFESEEIVWNLLQDRNGAPDVIVCLDEVDSEAVYQAVIDYNKVGDTLVCGYYKSSSTLEAIRKGTMAMTLYIDTAQLGVFSIKALEESIGDGRTNSFYSVDMAFITKDNVSDFAGK